MSFAKVYSGLVDGVDGELVTVETHLDNGLPGIHIVGLPDQAVKESQERIRPAIKESGFKFPQKKITVNLSPADKSKQGSTYDLPIAIGLLLASGQLQIPQSEVENQFLVGEIALDGELRPIPGILPLALEAEDKDFESMLLPRDNFVEAEPTGVQPQATGHLREAVAILEGRTDADIPDLSSDDGTVEVLADFSDVKGQESAKQGLSLAAAGGHNVLMIGPPGTGKSMLAKRLPGILPSLSRNQSLETTSVHSVAGEMIDRGALIQNPPFRAPHHTISGAGLIGGGRVPQPGEASLSHNGVLFLDELPEFQRSILETLRQPLESGYVQVSRAKASYRFPANFLLLGAMNPCPCGYLTHPDKQCICRPTQIDRYHQKLSGPLLDRIDLHISVGPVDYDSLQAKGGASSSKLREKVLSARDRQSVRYEDEPFEVNSDLPANKVDEYCPMSESTHDLLRKAVDREGYSARTVHRLKKVARTLADYEGDDKLTDRHMAQALQYRELTENRAA